MALSKLAVRRLTKLADFMASLPRSANKHFSMDMWFEHDGDHEHEFSGNTLSREDLEHCGTTACALGWGATMPYFKRLGLAVKPQRGYLMFRGRRANSPMETAAKVCNINFNDAITLFSMDVPADTPKQWARYCRKFIKENA